MCYGWPYCAASVDTTGPRRGMQGDIMRVQTFVTCAASQAR